MPTPFDEILEESLRSDESFVRPMVLGVEGILSSPTSLSFSSLTVLGGSVSKGMDGFCESGWFKTNRGKKELSSTNEDPRHVTPMITKKGAIKYILGTTRRKSMDVVAPM